jgi:hypothetical protein
VPGVTTIIGRFKDSGGLMYWAFEQGKASERGEIDRLYDKRDEAAEAGTLAHSLVEGHIAGTLPEPLPASHLIAYPEDVALQAMQGFENYLRWEATTKMQIVEQEIPLVSAKYKFGGTPDAIMVGEELALGDWKTSNKIYPDMLIQLAAYKVLWEENFPDRPITGGFHLCRFSKEHADFAHHYWAELDDAWEQFKLFREAYEIDKRLRKRV